jgi:hypothetical protein
MSQAIEPSLVPRSCPLTAPTLRVVRGEGVVSQGRSPEAVDYD